ncbi:MAG: hypothetical protein FJ297_07975 [Planctomycetes bacterium]|nr:hypothetical protein [Planctomycetota bacterium]
MLETRRLLAGIELISIDTTGDSAGSGFPVLAENPAISATGRHVAFQSAATDLVAGLVDTNGENDVFVRDRLLDVTIPISLAAGLGLRTASGRSMDPSISESGRYVAFSSSADDLISAPLIIDAPINVYVHDRDTDSDGVFDEPGATETRLLSLGASGLGDGDGIFGGPSGGDPFGYGVATSRPRIAGNGKQAAFASFADNFAAGITDANFTTDVFRVGTRGGASPVMISDDFTGTLSGGNGSPLPASHSPDISLSGSVVAFVSEANNLVKDAEVGTEEDIYVHNFTTGTTTLVSRNFAATDGGDADSDDPDLSADGRYVVWESASTDLTAPGVNTNGFAFDVFRASASGGMVELISVNGLGKTGSGASEDPSISDTGRFVAFESLASDLITDPDQLAAGVVDGNGVADIYARDTLFGTTALVSINAIGTASGIGSTPGIFGASINPVISGNGRYVVFESFAEDLAAGLTVAGRNLYVRDLTAGVTRSSRPISAEVTRETTAPMKRPSASSRR